MFPLVLDSCVFGHLSRSGRREAAMLQPQCGGGALTFITYYSKVALLPDQPVTPLFMTPRPVCCDLCQARRPLLTLLRALTTPTWMADCLLLQPGAKIWFFSLFSGLWDLIRKMSWRHFIVTYISVSQQWQDLSGFDKFDECRHLIMFQRGLQLSSILVIQY